MTGLPLDHRPVRPPLDHSQDGGNQPAHVGPRQQGMRPGLLVLRHDLQAPELHRGVDQGLEFQMLYGIARALQDDTASGRFPVRIYISYGEAWYPWFMRRLAERPANLMFFLKHLPG